MRNPETKDCSIEGCTRARRTGQLCSKHYALVPLSMGLKCANAVVQAGYDTALVHHAEQLEYVREKLATAEKVG